MDLYFVTRTPGEYEIVCIYVSGRGVGAKSIGIFEVSATNETTFQVSLYVLVVSPLVSVLVCLDPLHRINSHALFL